MALTVYEKERIMSARGESDSVMTEVRAFKVIFTDGKSTIMLSPDAVNLEQAIDFAGLKFGYERVDKVIPS